MSIETIKQAGRALDTLVMGREYGGLSAIDAEAAERVLGELLTQVRVQAERQRWGGRMTSKSLTRDARGRFVSREIARRDAWAEVAERRGRKEA